MRTAIGASVELFEQEPVGQRVTAFNNELMKPGYIRAATDLGNNCAIGSDLCLLH